MRDLLWRPRAHLDRESIALYLGSECGSPQVALSVLKEIDAALEMVSANPEAGRRWHDEKLGYEYRVVLAGNYRIFCRYDAETITVYRVLHQRQNLDDYTLIDM